MFESNFLEFFSHIHPWQPPAIYLPIIGYLVWKSFAVDVDLAGFLVIYAAGLGMWTLIEYVLHRFVFHMKPTSELGKKLIWILHGVHHDWPHDKFRLVFPPTFSLPLAALFFWICSHMVGSQLRYGLMAGLTSGYLAYDMIHYWVHHFAPRGWVGKFLRRYHLAHHFKSPETGFGVSSPLWDYLFRTQHTR